MKSCNEVIRLGVQAIGKLSGPTTIRDYGKSYRYESIEVIRAGICQFAKLFDLIQEDPRMKPNPFSTRFIQPGAIFYEFFDGGTVTELAERFIKLPSKRGIIIGPHGSGKSTLVASLVSKLPSIVPHSKIFSLRFSTDKSAAKSLNTSVKEWTPQSIAILDGYEQLRFWSRLRVEWIARARSISILATAHRSVRGFETIWETSVNESSSKWVVEQLLLQSGLPSGANELLQSEAWSHSRAKHGQNLRESLFDMYDWWQSSQSAEANR